MNPILAELTETCATLDRVAATNTKALQDMIDAAAKPGLTEATRTDLDAAMRRLRQCVLEKRLGLHISDLANELSRLAGGVVRGAVLDRSW